MFNVTKKSIQWGQETLTLETGKIARQADGSVIATLGEILPGILIVLIVAAFLDRFRKNRFVNAAFYGLRACSAGLIAAAGLLLVQIALINTDLFKQTGGIFDLIQWKGVLLALILVVLIRYVKKTKGLHPVVFIAASAVVGIVFRFAGV